MFLPACLFGVQAQRNFSTNETNGIGTSGVGGNEPPRGDNAPGQRPLGFDNAATELGVTSEELIQALGMGKGGSLDLAVGTNALGIAEDELRAILPPAPGQ